jgi:hypothetical protein
VTCSVYDDSLLGAGQAGSGGSSVAAGDGGGGSGAVAGSPPMPQAGAGTGGVTTAGSGGSGGGGGKGGSAGSAGNTTTAGAAGEENAGGGSPYELIDDMEDNDRFVIMGTGRDGYWQTENDGTAAATQTPLPGQSFAMTDLVEADAEREGSLYAAGMHVTGFVDSAWGALMVVSMDALGESIDASDFCGLHFWAKRGTGNAELVLKVVDKHSSPAGGLCTVGGAANQACYDDFHITLALTTQWTEQLVSFGDLVQYGTGYQSPTGKIDAAAIHGIAFSVDEAADFELLVDDLAFVRNGHCVP